MTPARKYPPGFTLIELVMVLVLAGIIAAVVAPMIIRGPSSLSVSAVASRVADDIRYARSLALRRSNLDTPDVTNPVFRYQVRFNTASADCPGPDNYSIVNDADNNGTWGENPNGSGAVESARNPADGSEYFCVRLDTGDLAGITASGSFGGSTPGIVEFDTLGIPYDSDGAKLASSGTVTVTGEGGSAAVTVTPNTGRVTVQ